MNSFAEEYIVQSDHRLAGVPGTGGTEVQVIVMKGKRPPFFLFDSNLGAPAALYYVEEEGSNTPFHSRFGTAKELPPDIHRVLRWWKQQAVINSTWGLGMPRTTFAEPPDETPLVVTKFTELPQRAIAQRALRNRIAILGMKDAAPGVDPKRIPAASYFLNTCDLLSKVQAHLMEVPNSGVTFGSGQWTSAEVLRYLNDRVNLFVERTGIVRKVAYVQVEQGVRTYELPTDLVELNRASLHVSGTVSPLYRVDKYSLDNGKPGWESTTGTPEAIIEEPLEYLDLMVYPTPSVNALLEIVYTPSFTLTNTPCDPIPVPAPFEPYLAWGVIADMLKREGELHDPERAEYADQRFEEGVQLAMLMRGDG